MKRNEEKKLKFKKETIQNLELNKTQMKEVAGGAASIKISLPSIVPVICA